MKKGCVIGCLIILGVSGLLVAILFAVISSALGLFAVDRVDLVQRYGDTHTIMVWVDPNSEHLQRLVELGSTGDSRLLRFGMPHEAMFFVDVEAENETMEATVAVSTKRFGRSLEHMMRGGNSDIFSLGGDLVTQDFGVDETGVFYVIAGGSLRPGVVEVARTHWSATAQVTTVEFEGGHDAEIIFNNGGGEAFMAMRSFESEVPLEPPDEPETPLEPSDEPDGANTAALLPETEDLWPTLFYQVSSARVTVDLVDTDTMDVAVSLRCLDEAAADKALGTLELLREQGLQERGEHDFVIESEFQQDGNRIYGTFIITGLEASMLQSIGDIQERMP